MKAVVISEDVNEIVEIKEIEELGEPQEGQIIVETTYISLCHSDLSSSDGEWNSRNIGSTVGHENVGRVVKLGPNVKNVKIGDNVAFPAGLHNACGKCKYCLDGNEVFCNNAKIGLGTMQKYCIEEAQFCTILPEGIDLAKAAIVTCAGLTVYKALKLANIKPNDFVTIFGIGGLGNMAVDYAKNVFQAKVIAVGSNKDSLKIAKQKGADFIINWKESNVEEEIKKITKEGTDVSLLTSSSDQLVQTSYDTLAKCGKVVIVGLPYVNIEVPVSDLVLKGKQIIGSLVGTRLDLQEALQSLADQKVNPEFDLVSIDEAPKYFKLMSENKLHKRIVFDFNI